MFRFQAEGEARSGTRVLANEQHAGEVVMAAPTALVANCWPLSISHSATRVIPRKRKASWKC
jgi:hypothetical protein